jgi:HD-GYP domain-containing protein (c-di-GMP phosphodiesterase class II)
MTTMPTTSRRNDVHYLATLMVMSVYGVQVCPFVELLSAAQIILPLAGVILFQWGLRVFTHRMLISRTVFENKVRTTFATDFSLFLFSGITITIFNAGMFDFPLGSGLKLLVGFAAIGFFVSVDLALESERNLANMMQSQGLHLKPFNQHFPIARKFSLFAAIGVVILVVVLFLVVNKDLDWLLGAGSHAPLPISEARGPIIIEFLFIGGVILLYMLTVIRSYARNLDLFFTNENRVLNDATQGRLEGMVSVATQDEFGIMARHTNTMVASLRDSMEEIQRTREATIVSLGSLAETRDPETGAHILRTQRYVRVLAEQLAKSQKFRKTLDPATIELIYQSAPLHDIGKVGIPDHILLKPAQLDEGEFTIMKTHPRLGADALREAEIRLGGSSFLEIARELILSHHEKWDGSGYPEGLKGEEIPLAGRLMAVADVYDALISERVYKKGMSHDKAMDILLDGDGTHFEPAMIQALRTVEGDFKQIAAQFQD